MPKFNINKIRSAGLRYLAVDMDGQMWAYEKMPIREGGHWRLEDKYLCPSFYGEEYLQYWNRRIRWNLQGRLFCCPIYDAPIELTFNDEPYDIIKNGLVNEKDFKIWPEANLRNVDLIKKEVSDETVDA